MANGSAVPTLLREKGPHRDVTGVVVNTIAVVLGGALGTWVLPSLKQSAERLALQGLGVAIAIIGIGQAMSADAMVIAIVSIVAGAVIGDALHLDALLTSFGNWIARTVPRFAKRGSDEGAQATSLSDGFVSATLLFLVGPMAIVGSLQAGISGDNQILLAKAALDGTTALVLSSGMGAGVLLSAVPLFLYQGAIVAAAGALAALLNGPVQAALTVTGGVMIAAMGLNMLGVVRVEVANLLPSLVVAAVIAALEPVAVHAISSLL